jgi:hypothetical protein
LVFHLTDQFCVNIIHLAQLPVGQPVSQLIILANCSREHLDLRQGTQEDGDESGT